MSRCQNCGRESPPTAAFCLNCGTRLQVAVPTPAAAAGLPVAASCAVCGGPNQPGMNFCRHCGSPMHGTAPQARAVLSHAPTPMAPPPGPPPVQPAPASTTTPTPPGLGRDRQLCRRCGGQTALGFAFCQHCGAPLGAAAEGVVETLAASGRTASPSGGSVGQALLGVAPTSPSGPTPVLATPPAGGAGSPAAPASRRPTPPLGAPVLARRPSERGAPWGTLVAVRRDGADGDRYALTGEWIEIGREGDLSFDDRHLAARHARLEKTPAGVRVVAIDAMNGVFKRLRAVEAVASGCQLLTGRELMRLDLVEGDERDVVPLVRHGVAMFGSPPRKPWGRLSQLLANGGVRDVRHLYGAEFVIGREDGDLVFRDDEFLSRRHLILRWSGSQCTAEDLKSSNGSFVRLRGALILGAGDVLRMGDQMFRFEATA